MGGSGIGIVQSRPMVVDSSPDSSVWIMFYCDGSSVKMVQLVVQVRASGQAVVFATAAGRAPSTSTTNQLTLNQLLDAWKRRVRVDVATCDICSGYGVRYLAFILPGSNMMQFLFSLLILLSVVLSTLHVDRVDRFPIFLRHWLLSSGSVLHWVIVCLRPSR